MKEKTLSKRIFTQTLIVVLVAAYAAFLFLNLQFVDNEGTFSRKEGIFNGIIEFFGIEKFNVYIFSWIRVLYVLGGICLFAVFASYIPVLTYGLKQKADLNSRYSKKYIVVLFSCYIAAILIVVIIVAVLFNYDITKLVDAEVPVDDGINFSQTLFALLKIFLIYSVIIALVSLLSYGIYRLIKFAVDLRSGKYDKQEEKKAKFPALVHIDENYYGKNLSMENQAQSLEEIAKNFHDYLYNVKGFHFSENVVRAFIAGLAASHIILLEGVSGTGKSSLPRLFAEFTDSNAYFIPVQSNWRDRTDLLGFFNEFSGIYKETPFLEDLYKSCYFKDKLSVFVIDEANLSRMEFYFADLLSVLEFPVNERKIRITQNVDIASAPKFMEEGSIPLSENCYFIATANKDESTFDITDRVYDRAITIELDEVVMQTDVGRSDSKLRVTAQALRRLFDEAVNGPYRALSTGDANMFRNLSRLCSDMFGFSVGNRIFDQLDKFTAVFVACGGDKNDALDLIFATKILRKINNGYEEFYEENLVKLAKKIEDIYGRGSFPISMHAISELKKKTI